MPYSPPDGWIELLEAKSLEADSQLGVFHTRNDCPRIGSADQLRQVDKPYSARRCPGCATV